MKVGNSYVRGFWMIKDESGFSTPLALTVIFSLCVITLSFSMIVASNEKKINSYRNLYERRKDINSIIDIIEKTLQRLRDYSNDIDEYQIARLLLSECDYEFKIKDVSTGINKQFVDKKILENEYVKKYVTGNETVAFVDYGWINSKFSDKSIIYEIEKNYKDKNVFPLINNLPPLNIHAMNENLIRAVLASYKIKNIDRKTEGIREVITSEISIKDIAEILGISESHAFFDLVGLKTIFWQIEFETENCIAKTIFAAVPEKNNHKKIEKYILVKKDISHKGGVL